MANSLHDLRESLLRAGIAPRHVCRYLAELADHLADLRAEEEGAGCSRAEAEAAALIRLGGEAELSQAMIDQRQFQSWSARAPWAAFGLAPLLLLAAAYLVACLILWSGWRLFLPQANTPFVRIDGIAIFYFGIGRLFYFAAPVLIGWGLALLAVRQRLQAIWPVVGSVLLAWIGATAHVHASRVGGARQIGMDLALGTSLESIFQGLLHALVILSFALLPYLLGRLQRARSFSA
jgi:hypothetical protein